MDAWRIRARCAVFGGLFASALAVLSPGAGLAQESDQGLQRQLSDLARAEGISLSGLDLIGAAPARTGGEPGALGRRLGSLLVGFNYVLVGDARGRISALRVLGPARAGPPRIAEATVPAIRQGAHYLVDAVLVGPTGLWTNRRLIVDTGASTVVLPDSAIPGLGLREIDLFPGTVETAGGKVPARQGWLTAVQVGHARVEDVAVTFIADAQLGQAALLGMSFLEHFRVTFDDSARRIILVAK